MSTVGKRSPSHSPRLSFISSNLVVSFASSKGLLLSTAYRSTGAFGHSSCKKFSTSILVKDPCPVATSAAI
jgi:hypothetical protein